MVVLDTQHIYAMEYFLSLYLCYIKKLQCFLYKKIAEVEYTISDFALIVSKCSYKLKKKHFFYKYLVKQIKLIESLIVFLVSGNSDAPYCTT